jgi:hypothetical protein
LKITWTFSTVSSTGGSCPNNHVGRSAMAEEIAPISLRNLRRFIVLSLQVIGFPLSSTGWDALFK